MRQLKYSILEGKHNQNWKEDLSSKTCKVVHIKLNMNLLNVILEMVW